ncbi:hypothetical protein [Prochlorococcus sp. MIT 1300]|uniref:hypothetical protein n=1 Tax=Prochlorococcus sp. MIT 1300 TaxID=3096218 RepID=UPI002A7637D6|nr:hypothetical protein [Prochlorococcus sp. MIT 1300]
METYDYEKSQLFFQTRDKVSDKWIWGTSKLEDWDNIAFGKEVKKVRIDVGLSNDASQSAKWIIDNPDRGIIGIEPHPQNIEVLFRGSGKLNQLSLLTNSANIADYVLELINGRFFLIQGAIDNINEPSTAEFYSAYPDKGNSSLIKCQDTIVTGNMTDLKFKVAVNNLRSIIDKLDLDKYRYIECIKVDTEGKDLEVLQSCGDQIFNTVFLKVELFRGYFPESIKAIKENRIESLNLQVESGRIIIDEKTGFLDGATYTVNWLKERDFELIAAVPGNWIFLNKRFKETIYTDGLHFS